MNAEFKIPFSGRSHKYSKNELDKVLEVMNSATTLTQGCYLHSFQNAFLNFQETNGNSFAVGSATDALELTAQLCCFKSGDEFVIPAHTYTSSCYPFIKHGGKPIWADIDLETRVITSDTIEKCITSKTRAIIIVHLYGFVAEMDKILDLAKSKNLIVIEDCAQAIGSRYKGKRAGTFGKFGIFSFHSHKNITTLGEGGMLWTNDKRFADVIPLLRHNGHCQFSFQKKNYWTPAMSNVDLPEIRGESLLPNNYCLGEAQCALGVELLKRIDSINSLKRARAISFIDALDDFPELKFHRIDDERHNYHLLVAYLESGKRDSFIQIMAEKYQIQCVVQYYPLNRYDLYRKLGFAKASIPNTNLFFDNMVSFPFQQTLSESDLSYMLECTRKTLRLIK